MSEKKESSEGESSEKIAVVLVRGLIGIKSPIKDTLQRLNIFKKHICVVVPKTPSMLGMIVKVKDYVAYGEVDEETFALLRKREETVRKDGKEIPKKFFRLSPPKGGFGRKGIKKSFNVRGALGYRGKEINNLIKRML